MPFIFFVWVLGLESVLLAVGLVIFYSFKGQNLLDWKFDRQICKDLLRDTWPVIISGIAIAVYMRIDQIMIKGMLDAAAVGYYSAAVRISEVFYFLPAIITGSVFPAIIKSKLEDEVRYNKRLLALFTILLWSAIGASIFFTLLAKPIVLTLFGAEYSPAIPVLMVHTWGSLFVFLGVVRTKWAINENYQIYIMFYVILGAVINVVLNLIFIPRTGIIGAAFSTVIAQFVAAMLSNLCCSQTRPIFLLQIRSFNPNELRSAWRTLKNNLKSKKVQMPDSRELIV